MKKEIKILKVLILTISLLFSVAQKSEAQPVYKFNFDKEWDWVEFIYGGYDISEEAKTNIKSMSECMELADAWLLFKNLSLLDSINQIKLISEIALIDSSIYPNNNKFIIDSLLKDFSELNTLNGLIYTAYKLLSLRVNPPFSAKTFVKREQLTSLTDTVDVKFNLEYNYTGAETILDLLDYDTEDYYLLLDEKTKDYTDKLLTTKEKINNCFKYAVKNTPLFNIYKIIYPSSFGNLGGIYIYRNQFRTALNQIKVNEEQIRFEIKNRIFQFLPGNINLNSKIIFSFAFETKNDFLRSGNLIFNIETIGNDHRLIYTNLSRILFEKGKDRSYINILPYIFDKSDSLYAKIIGGVHEGGLLNYIAPTSIENRPLSLLEKDFMHFRRTCNEIKKGTDMRLIDTLISLGFQGLGLFYTMGTQMAFNIEKAQGKSAIKNSMIYGPFYYFKTYINAYKENPKDIRQIFRFTPEFEDKINSMARKIPDEIIFAVASLSMEKGSSDNNSDSVWNKYLFTKTTELQNKYYKRKNGYTVYLLTAEVLFKNELYSEAASSYMKAYFDISDKKKFFNLVSNKFYNAGAYTACIEFIDEFMRYDRTITESYLLRGKSYIKLNNFDKATEDLETVLLLDPINTEAYLLLYELESEKEKK